MKFNYIRTSVAVGLLCAAHSAGAAEVISGTSSTGFEYEVPAEFKTGRYANKRYSITLYTSAPISAQLSLGYDSEWDIYQWPSRKYVNGNESCCLSYNTDFSPVGTKIKLVRGSLPEYIQYLYRDFSEFGDENPRLVRKYYDYVFNFNNVVFNSQVPVNYTAVFAAVPEPGTWIMLMVGFGLIGSAMRRKTLRSVRVARSASA